MHATILHECRGRIRLRLKQKSISLRQADLLEEWLSGSPGPFRAAVVHERTRCVILYPAPLETEKLASPAPVLLAGAEHPSSCPPTAPGL